MDLITKIKFKIYEHLLNKKNGLPKMILNCLLFKIGYTNHGVYLYWKCKRKFSHAKPLLTVMVTKEFEQYLKTKHQP